MRFCVTVKMSDKTSRYVVEVIGLEQLRAWSAEQATLEKRALAVQRAMMQTAAASERFDVAAKQSTLATARLNTEVARAAEIAARMADSQGRLSTQTQAATRSSDNFLLSMLKYRAVSAVFQGIESAVGDVISKLNEYDKQAARVSRVTGAGGRPLALAAMQNEAIRTGSNDIRAQGEAYYQLSISIKNNQQLLDAYKTTMALVVGQEGEARESARALVTIHALFREELNRTIPVGEQYQRIGELVSMVWKNGNLELPEFIQTLKYLGPVMKGVQADLSQTFAIAQGFSELGMRGRMIGTGFGSLVQQVAGKSDTINAKLQAKGFQPIQLFQNEHGGLDVVKTIDLIVQHMQALTGQSRQTYAEIVGGSKNSIRTLEALDAEATNKMKASLIEYQAALAGKTHLATDLLKASTDTFVDQFHRAWNGVIFGISNGIDLLDHRLLNLKAGLKDFADTMERASGAKTYNLTEGNLLKTEGPYDHAVHMMGITEGILGLVNNRNKSNNVVDPNRVPLDDIRAALTDSQYGAMRTLLHPRHDAYTSSEADYVTLQDLHNLETSLGGEAARFRPMDPAQRTSAALSSARLEGTPNAAGAAIAEHLKDAIETPAFQASCAYFASEVMKKAGLAVPEMGSAHGLRDYLVAHGAQQVPNNQLQPGDFLLFKGKQYGTGKDTNGDGYHAALYEGNGMMRQSSGIGSGHVTDRPLTDFAHLTAYRLTSAFVGYDASGLISPEKQADEKRQKSLEALRDHQRMMQDDFRAAEKSLNDFQKDLDHPLDPKAFDAKLAPLVTAYEAAKQRLIEITRAVAATENDPATLRNIKKDRLVSDPDTDEARKKNRQQYLDSQKDRGEYFADQAVKSYGLFSPMAEYRAHEAQNAAVAAELAKNGQGPDLWRLQAGDTGPMASLVEKRQPQFEALTEAARQAMDIFDRILGPQAQQSNYVSGVTQGTSARIRALQLSMHPSSIFTDHTSEETGVAQGTVSILQKAIADLSAVAQPSKETSDALRELKDQLAQATYAVANLKDVAKAAEFQKSLKQIDTAYDETVRGISTRRKPRTTNENSIFGFEDRKLLDLVSAAADVLTVKKALPFYVGKEGDVAGAQKNLDEAGQRERQYRQEYADSEYFQQRDRLTGYATTAAVGLYKGEKPTAILKNIGDDVVTSSITKFIKGMFDPQVNALGQNTDAVKGLTAAMNGTGGAGQAGGAKTGNLMGLLGIAGGLAATSLVHGRSIGGGASAGDVTADGKPVGRGAGVPTSGNFGGGKGATTGNIANAALGAYGIFTAGQQNGPLAGAVGGAVGGASIGASFGPAGGLIGAGIGGLLGLFGGLFGGHHHQDTTARDMNPAATYAPEGFAYEAYRFRATGQLPTNTQLGLNLQQQNQPIQVVVSLDGMKQILTSTINGATTTAAASLGNTFPNLSRPI